MNSVAPYAKAVTAAILAALTALGVALIPDATANVGSEINAVEWVSIAVAFITALSAVWAIPNTDPSGTHQGESVQPAEPEVTHPIYPVPPTEPTPPSGDFPGA